MTKKIAAILISAAFAATGFTALSATPASASGYNCVSTYEYHHTYVGDSKRPLEKFYGTHGWTAAFGGGTWVKKYYACGPYWSIVRIRYTRTNGVWRVAGGTRW